MSHIPEHILQYILEVLSRLKKTEVDWACCLASSPFVCTCIIVDIHALNSTAEMFC